MLLSASRLSCGARASATLSVCRQLANHLRSTAVSSAVNRSTAWPPWDRVDLPAAYKVSLNPIPASNFVVPAGLGCEIESRSPYSYAVAGGERDPQPRCRACTIGGVSVAGQGVPTGTQVGVRSLAMRDWCTGSWRLLIGASSSPRVCFGAWASTSLPLMPVSNPYSCLSPCTLVRIRAKRRFR
jgi:hypothetical protein